MTRQDLIGCLTLWDPPEKWDAGTFKERDALQFALWWYGASTEASKDNPSWPDTDYVESKTGGGPRYLDSIDDALTLVPKSWAWSIQRSDRTACDVWLYPPNNVDDREIHVTHRQMPPAVCIAAIAARLWSESNQQRKAES